METIEEPYCAKTTHEWVTVAYQASDVSALRDSLMDSRETVSSCGDTNGL